MKAITSIWLFLCGLLVLFTGGFRTPDYPPIPQAFGEDILISAEQLRIRKEYPTTVSFPLRKGDRVNFECAACDILMKNGSLRMELQSFDPPVKTNISRLELRDGVTVDFDDTYTLQLISNKRPILIEKLVATADRVFSIDRPVEWLNISNVYIGSESKKKNLTIPRFECLLEEGDSIEFVVTGVAEALPNVLTMNLEKAGFDAQTPVDVDQAGLVSVQASSTGGTYYYSFKAEAEKISSIIGRIKEIFDPKTDFFNIVGRRFPKPDPAVTEAANTQNNQGEIIEEEDPNAAIKALVEQLIPKQTAGLIPLPGQKISVPIQPVMNLAASSRRCESLIIPGPAELMVFWLGTGSGAQREFATLEREKYKSLSSYKEKLPTELLGMYAHSILIDPDPSSFLFQSQRTDSVFREHIEFVIVDRAGKEQFERGGNPSPKVGTLRVEKTFHGAKANITDKELYLCMCNRNKYTPVNVSFNYSFYNKQKLEEAAQP